MSEPVTFTAGALYLRWAAGPAPSGTPVIPAPSVVELCSDITAPADPTGDTVQAAIMPLGSGDPDSGDWHAAAWEPGSTWTAGQPVTAMALIGPGTSFALAAGTCRAWFKVSASPEAPVLDAGLLVIT